MKTILHLLFAQCSRLAACPLRLGIAPKCRFLKITAAVCLSLTALESFGTTAFTNLYSFTNGVDGSMPYAGLTLGTNGNYYGTTYEGGSNKVGTIFEITPSGVFTPLYSFTNGDDGAYPMDNLTLGSDGNFYGTTYAGGTNRDGTIFQMTPTGTMTILHQFAGKDGAGPEGALLEVSPGTFYGTTSEGGTTFYGVESYFGVVFSITSAGEYTLLYSFDEFGGGDPFAALARGIDGNFYGTTGMGGSDYTYGTIYEVTSEDVVLTNLFSFTGGLSGPNGVYPDAPLTLGSNGVFYGTTRDGGTNYSGTVFTFTTDRTFTLLYVFTGNSDGGGANGLTLGADGNFYGSAAYGGLNNDNGTLFRMTPAGSVTGLYTFSGGNDGAEPLGALVQNSAGTFYGTTSGGGTSNYGTIFCASFGDGPEITAQPANETRLAGTNVTLSVTASGASPLHYQWLFNGTNLTDGDAISGSGTNILAIQGITSNNTGTYQLIVTNSYGITNSVPVTLTVVGMQAVISPDEYTALGDFYTSTVGTTWATNSNWMMPVAFPWYGVGVDDIQFDPLGNVIGPGHVTSLELGSNKLSGTLASDFTSLAQLESIDLYSNAISGVLPDGLLAMSETLTNFDVHNNKLSNGIPSDLGEVTELGNLDLSANKLNGAIPVFEGVPVTNLDLSGNQLTGTLMNVSTLSELQRLNLSGNKLTGSIPQNFVIASDDLTYLDLSKNMLTGVVPSVVEDFPDLQYLDLSHNSITNGLTTIIGANLSALSFLNLSFDGMSGSIPANIGNLGGLTQLFLAGNQFTGDIPPSVTNAASLIVLDVSTNHLGGPIPDVSSIVTLQTFHLQWNDLDVTPGDSAGITNLGILTNILKKGTTVVFLPQNPPASLSKEKDLSVISGTSNVLSVTANGAVPLAFQWRINGTNLSDAAEISGSQTASLTIDPTQTADQGTYQVVITNAFGSVTSEITVLTVTARGQAPQITAQPTNQTVLVGASATFSVTATGTSPLTYQWMTNNVPLPGATNSAVTIASATPANAGYYASVVANAYGTNTSTNAALSVLNIAASFGGIQVSNGKIVLQLTGLTGQGTVVVDASTNLANWIPIFTNIAAFGTIDFVDTNASNSTHRYYRATTPASQ
ncbi:MAG TPA: choice-of-anchor tandem repeat GloVer-containing protein [Verrucomicrobiae bacterium]|jgi:uncharacterized repeat protein (TIGR03803 family)|nr:choice-of-anchor tandem repeat GloVer-containing protein [Verrucomicrobiae bacterium]